MYHSRLLESRGEDLNCMKVTAVNDTSSEESKWGRAGPDQPTLVFLLLTWEALRVARSTLRGNHVRNMDAQ